MVSKPKRCSKGAVYRYTWPGMEESFCCELHAKQICAVGKAMKNPVQMISLAGIDKAPQCTSHEELIQMDGDQKGKIIIGNN